LRLDFFALIFIRKDFKGMKLACNSRFQLLNSLHIQMKLKQNRFKTVLKLFCLNFISVCGFSVRHSVTMP